MGLFIDVTELAGDCIVSGQVRRCSYRGGAHTNGALTIDGLTLTDALAVLKALGSDSIVGAHLTGVLPATPAQQAPVERTPADAPVMTENPQAKAAREAGWRTPDDEPRASAPVQQAPAADPQGGLPGVAAVAPAQPPPAVPAAPQQPATAPDDGVPDDVMRAATLRPVVGWLSEQGVAGTVDAMYPRVRGLIDRMAKSSPLSRLADDELRTRIKSTLERLELLKG